MTCPYHWYHSLNQLTKIITMQITGLLKMGCTQTFHTGCLESSPWVSGIAVPQSINWEAFHTHSVSALMTADNHCLQLCLWDILLKVKPIKWKHGWYENKLLKIISATLKKKPLIPSFRTFLILLAAATLALSFEVTLSALTFYWFGSFRKTHFLQPVLWWPAIK